MVRYVRVWFGVRYGALGAGVGWCAGLVRYAGWCVVASYTRVVVGSTILSHSFTLSPTEREGPLLIEQMHILVNLFARQKRRHIL
jgi:hypothetical protein